MSLSSLMQLQTFRQCITELYIHAQYSHSPHYCTRMEKSAFATPPIYQFSFNCPQVLIFKEQNDSWCLTITVQNQVFANCFHIHLLKFLCVLLKSEFSVPTRWFCYSTTSSEANCGPIWHLHRCVVETFYIAAEFVDGRYAFNNNYILFVEKAYQSIDMS